MAATRRALARPFDRPGLAALFDYARPGDTLAIIRLDRLGRSLRELLEIADTLKEQEFNRSALKKKSTPLRQPTNRCSM